MTTNLRDQLQATLSGTHTLERELGGGGMSKVFVAEETRLGRRVVIKVLSPELAQGISVDRFEREIKTVAALQQANIVPVISAGDTNGLPYYTMPFVEGESLRAKLGQGPLPVAQVVSVLRDVARALAYAHQRGVVHRDIKPDNVLLSGGAAVVTDFGIAKAISAARTSGAGATLTQVGTSIGTPAYMAPEQAAGDANVDHRADIYSLGAMAYELLTGQAVFAGRTPQRMLAAHMSEVPRTVSELRPDVPASLADLVMRCLAKEAAQRPQSAGDVAQALETTSAGSMAAMPPILIGGPAMFKKALAIYAGAFVVVAVLAKAAIVGIGLPEWVFAGSLIVMALGLPVVLWTGYVQRVARRAVTATPTFTPGGSPATAAHGTMATMALKAAPQLSWHKTARGGMYAFGVFIVVIGAFMAMRQFGIGPFGSLVASGKMSVADQLLVPDFTAPGSDSALGGGLADALRANLANSRVVNLLPSKAIGDALDLMKRSRDTRVTPAIAQEIASRTGAKLILTGDVSTLTGGYLVRVKLATAAGEEIAAFQETADGVKDLIPAMDRLGRTMRGKIGESFRVVNSEPPLTAVTTASLPALKKFTEGARATDEREEYSRGISLLNEAIALDSTFAMAYRKLAIAQRNLANALGSNDYSAATTVLAAGVRHIDKLPEAERLAYLGVYYQDFGPHPDRAKSVDAYEQLFRRHPEWKTIITSTFLAIHYETRREFARAESTNVAIMQEAPTESGPYLNIIGSQVATGRFAEARKSVERARERIPFGRVDAIEALVLHANGMPDSAEVAVRRRAATANGAQRVVGEFVLAGLAQIRGQLREAGTRSSALRKTASAAGRVGAPLIDSLADIRVALVVAERPDDAARRLDAVVAKNPISAMPVRTRPYADVASLYAMAGKPDRARAVLAQFEREVTDTVAKRLASNAIASARAWIDLAEGRPRDAVTGFRGSDRLPDGPLNDCMICIDPGVGTAFDKAQMPDSAIAAFEHYVNTAYVYRMGSDAINLAWILERLGELHESKGNNVKAAEYYQRFVELWKNADPELQPRVKAARERLAKLTPVEKPR